MEFEIETKMEANEPITAHLYTFQSFYVIFLSPQYVQILWQISKGQFSNNLTTIILNTEP